jgi:hypothetical protein
VPLRRGNCTIWDWGLRGSLSCLEECCKARGGGGGGDVERWKAPENQAAL